MSAKRRHPRVTPVEANAQSPAGTVAGDASGRHVLVREEPGRLLVTVRVTPRAGRDTLSIDGGELRARLAAPPVDGAANEALVALLAAHMKVPRRAVTLVRGATAREKVVAIAGITASEFWSRVTT